jgi:hypothetical protein
MEFGCRAISKPLDHLASYSGRTARPRPSRLTPPAAHYRRPQPLQIPGDHGAYWWLGLSTTHTPAPVYGDTFVIFRPRIGGEGLVVRPPQPPIQRYQPPTRPCVPQPRLLPGPASVEVSLACLPFIGSAVIIDTEYEVVEGPEGDDADVQAAGGSFVAPRYGIVPVNAAKGAPAASGATHPRRTRAVSFRCNLCGEAQRKMVNPYAWRSGSVFARCTCCSAVHKLVDNLRIFHELGGDVFPPKHLRESVLVQKVLDRIKERREKMEGGADPTCN